MSAQWLTIFISFLVCFKFIIYMYICILSWYMVLLFQVYVFQLSVNSLATILYYFFSVDFALHCFKRQTASAPAQFKIKNQKFQNTYHAFNIHFEMFSYDSEASSIKLYIFSGFFFSILQQLLWLHSCCFFLSFQFYSVIKYLDAFAVQLDSKHRRLLMFRFALFCFVLLYLHKTTNLLWLIINEAFHFDLIVLLYAIVV